MVFQTVCDVCIGFNGPYLFGKASCRAGRPGVGAAAAVATVHCTSRAGMGQFLLKSN